MKNQDTKTAIIAGLILLIVFATIIINAREKSICITKSQYQDEWAFSVDTLCLKCDNGMVTATDSKGQHYYLNGLASGRYSQDSNYKDISTIQIDDVEMNKVLKTVSNGQPFTPVKKSISFATNKGLELCNAKR